MHHQKHTIIDYVWRTVRHSKAMGKAFFVTPFFLFLVLPLLTLWVYFQSLGQYGTTAQGEHDIFLLYQHTIPFFSIYWPLLAKKNLWEQPGSEVFHACHDPLNIRDEVVYFLMYSSLMLLFFLFLSLWFDWAILEGLRLVCINFFLFSLQRFLFALLGSAVICFILCFLLCTQFQMWYRAFPNWMLYYPLTSYDQLKGYLVFILVALLLEGLRYCLPIAHTRGKFPV